MVLAGKKTSELKCETAQEFICPNCNTKNSTVVSVIGTYKHLFHIPFFAGSKFGKSVCSNCNLTLNLDKMPNAIKLAYYELKETAKTPFWFFSGTFAIKVLVLIKIFSRYF